MFRFHALSVKALFPYRYPKLDQVVNVVGCVIWSMLAGSRLDLGVITLGGLGMAWGWFEMAWGWPGDGLGMVK